MLQTLWVEPQRRISQSNRITINAAPMIQPRAELNRLSHSPLICGLDITAENGLANFHSHLHKIA